MRAWRRKISENCKRIGCCTISHPFEAQHGFIHEFKKKKKKNSRWEVKSWKKLYLWRVFQTLETLWAQIISKEYGRLRIFVSPYLCDANWDTNRTIEPYYTCNMWVNFLRERCHHSERLPRHPWPEKYFTRTSACDFSIVYWLRRIHGSPWSISLPNSIIFLINCCAVARTQCDAFN